MVGIHSLRGVHNLAVHENHIMLTKYTRRITNSIARMSIIPFPLAQPFVILIVNNCLLSLRKIDLSRHAHLHNRKPPTLVTARCSGAPCEKAGFHYGLYTATSAHLNTITVLPCGNEVNLPCRKSTPVYTLPLFKEFD